MSETRNQKLGEALSTGFLLLLGIVGTGLLSSYFENHGYPIVGEAIFVLGYGTMVLALWWIWIRPIDFEGPL